MARVGRSPATIGLVVLFTLAHVVALAMGWDVSSTLPSVERPAWWPWALSRQGVGSGCVWQVVSYAFLHGSWIHLISNALVVLGVGSQIEHVLGGRAVWRACLLGVVAGAVSHLLLGHGVLVGFSGAALALCMLQVGLDPQSRLSRCPVPVLWLGWGFLWLSLGCALCDPDGPCRAWHGVGEWLVSATGIRWFEVGHACHWGGGLAGWWMASWVMRPRVTLAGLRKQRARHERR